jgi:hypothetical protein
MKTMPIAALATAFFSPYDEGIRRDLHLQQAPETNESERNTINVELFKTVFVSPVFPQIIPGFCEQLYTSRPH